MFVSLFICWFVCLFVCWLVGLLVCLLVLGGGLVFAGLVGFSVYVLVGFVHVRLCLSVGYCFGITRINFL